MSLDPETLLDARLRMPEHVVHRGFMTETVILNLETGKYHGLNRSGGEMLDILGKSPTPRDAAATLAKEYGLAPDTIEADLVTFCGDLLERGLLELVETSG